MKWLGFCVNLVVWKDLGGRKEGMKMRREGGTGTGTRTGTYALPSSLKIWALWADMAEGDAAVMILGL